MTLTFEGIDADTTRAIGQRLGKILRGGDVLLLVGPLGAGKTTFVQGLAKGLGVIGQVTSPTYIVARVHESEVDGPHLVHVDAYRLEDDLDLETVDLDASVDQAVTVVEWGRGRAEVLSDQRLEIEFAFGSDSASSVTDASAGTAEDLPENTYEEPRMITFIPLGPQWELRLKEAGLA